VDIAPELSTACGQRFAILRVTRQAAPPRDLARGAAAKDPANDHLTFIRLTSRRDITRFLAAPPV
jgi:hypothetical protein